MGEKYATLIEVKLNEQDNTNEIIVMDTLMSYVMLESFYKNKSNLVVKDVSDLKEPSYYLATNESYYKKSMESNMMIYETCKNAMPEIASYLAPRGAFIKVRVEGTLDNWISWCNNNTQSKLEEELELKKYVHDLLSNKNKKKENSKEDLSKLLDELTKEISSNKKAEALFNKLVEILSVTEESNSTLEKLQAKLEEKKEEAHNLYHHIYSNYYLDFKDLIADQKRLNVIHKEILELEDKVEKESKKIGD